jgi:hypothetical protein
LCSTMTSALSISLMPLRHGQRGETTLHRRSVNLRLREHSARHP